MAHGHWRHHQNMRLLYGPTWEPSRCYRCGHPRPWWRRLGTGVLMHEAGTLSTALTPVGGAWISVDQRYRYALTRTWGDHPGRAILDEPRAPRGVCWVMLNPSTADANEDDPTIRRCLGFTRTWGYDRLVVVNLFALRSTDPKALVGHPDPVGRENEAAMTLAIDSSELVVAAWGASYPKALSRHVLAVRKELRGRGAKCLGLTSSAEPRHPLYVKGDTDLMDLW